MEQDTKEARKPNGSCLMETLYALALPCQLVPSSKSSHGDILVPHQHRRRKKAMSQKKDRASRFKPRPVAPQMGLDWRTLTLS